MPKTAASTAVSLTKAEARRVWLRAQRLDTRDPFGGPGPGRGRARGAGGSAATLAAVEHLGYVQIDTINVIERCHHHILWSRIPAYRRADLHRAQSVDRSVFEYFTHALSYVPTRDLRFFLPEMRRQRREPRKPWNLKVTDADLRKVLNLLRSNGPLTIRDIKDDVLVEKEWAWASRKPSKGALDVQSVRGVVMVSERTGMLKTYDLTERHFGWDAPPRPATERQVMAYQLDRALRSQGLVSLDSACYQRPRQKPAMRELVDARVRRRQLVPVAVEDARQVEHWAEPETLDTVPAAAPDLVHILSPFDPLIIQRKRLEFFFAYEHRFEAYVPKEKRIFGYFTLPVLIGDTIVAAIDVKTDREQGTLLMQQWNWVGRGNARSHQTVIDEELARFERFQLES